MSRSPMHPVVTLPWFQGPSCQRLRTETLRAWERILEHGRFVGGEEIDAFEERFGALLGAPCAGVASGTAALQLALRVCNVGPGDEVVLPGLSFFATAEPVFQLGARPVFADIDPLTGTLDPAACEAALTERTRAIVPVHLFGRLAAMEPLVDLATQRGLAVVEDAAQAHGATRDGRPAGTLGDAGAFSFHPTKNLPACGDAGAVVSRDPKRVERVRGLRNHGQPTRQRHDEVGTCERMDSLQAAALSLRLERLDEWTATRRRLAGRYREALDGLVELASPAPAEEDACHLFVIRHPRRDELAGALARDGIGTAVHYPRPLHLQPALAALDLPQPRLPVAERWARENLTLPLYPDLTADQVDRVCASVASFCASNPVEPV